MPSSVAKDLQYGPVVAVVNSNSEPSKKYEVRKNPEGFLSCQCMGWRFNKDSPRHCKHTDVTQGTGKVKAMPHAAVAAAHAQGGPTVKDEALRVSKAILQRANTVNAAVEKFATEQIEAAIKKFMSVLAAPAVTEFQEVQSGVRMITLDD